MTTYTVTEPWVAQFQALLAGITGVTPLPSVVMLALTGAPTSVTHGAQFQATFHVVNTTGQTMPSGSSGFPPYRIGAQNPRDNVTWGVGRILLPADLPSGQSVDVTATLTAPSTPGTYAFAWQMVQEGVKWIDGTLVQQSMVVQ